jgi:hypothetical protein
MFGWKFPITNYLYPDCKKYNDVIVYSLSEPPSDKKEFVELPTNITKILTKYDEKRHAAPHCVIVDQIGEIVDVTWRI